MYLVWTKQNGQFWCWKLPVLIYDKDGKEPEYVSKYKLTEEEYKLSLNELKKIYPPPEV